MTDSAPLVSQFNAVDVGLLVLLALSALIGVIRGFTREFLGIAGWAGAFFVTIWGLPLLKPVIRTWIGTPFIADIISALSLFIISFVTFMTAIRALSNHVKSSILGSLDRSLGLLFGILRGCFIALCLFLLSPLIWKPEARPPLLLCARSYPLLINATESVLLLLPKGLIPTSYFKQNNKELNSITQSPEKLMQALSQPKPKESGKSRNEGYQDKHRHSMDRLIQNYKAEDEI